MDSHGKGVLSIYGPWEEVTPFVLFFTTICSEVTSNFLIESLNLPVRLGMISRGEGDIDVINDINACHTLEVN